MIKVFKKIGATLKDFFNMKEWVKLLRAVPGVALALITVSTVLMNVLANKSIIELPWLLQDAGIIISWIGFLVGDLLVKTFGAKNAIRVNLTCLAMSLIVSALLAVVAVIPGTWSSEFDYPGAGPAIDAVMGNVWYVIIGSAVASAIGLILNGLSQGFLLNKIEKKHGDKYLGYLAACAASTVLGQFVDNIVFASIVGVPFFGWGINEVLVVSVCGAIFEIIVEMAFTPLTYRICKNWEKNRIGVKFMVDAESEADKEALEANIEAEERGDENGK